jgi:hypothetical protein
MDRKTFSNKPWVVIILSLIFAMPYTDAFARSGGRSHYEVVRVGHDRYHYRDGRFYRPGFFGFGFSFVTPSIGVTISTLPYGHRTIIVGGSPYYYYDNVYYRSCPNGYVVVPEPVAPANITYMPSAVQSQGTNRETVTINVPNSNGGTIAITLVRYPNGFVGPQGEFYPNLPTAEQLKVRYGR